MLVRTKAVRITLIREWSDVGQNNALTEEQSAEIRSSYHVHISKIEALRSQLQIRLNEVSRSSTSPITNQINSRSTSPILSQLPSNSRSSSSSSSRSSSPSSNNGN